MNDEHSERKGPVDLGVRGEPGALPPIAPDGGLVGELISSTQALSDSPADFVCLRGPCRYYLQITARAEVIANVPYQPVAISRFCGRLPGVEIDVTEDNVLDCNSWDPMDTGAIAEVNYRRNNYLRAHPECASADRARSEARERALREQDEDAADDSSQG